MHEIRECYLNITVQSSYCKFPINCITNESKFSGLELKISRMVDSFMK